MKKTLLSIGIIFKNEIRCIERCLKSLQPLRDALPCEVVMADTGADDGSRAVAEQYADILFDFPWINDFAAARNAVMDRASGTWFMTVDADEWLDKDISNLVDFLKNPLLWKKTVVCGVTVRNYTRYDLTGGYSDFAAVRMLRMSTGIRYVGTIHERWDGNLGVVCQLDVIFHHDGYVGFGDAKGAAKRERNMVLLREEYKKNPDDLLLCLQCIESSQGEEMAGYIRTAMEGVRERKVHWDHVGPAVFRYAVFMGKATRKPEWRDWAAEGEELFPRSYFIRIDIGSFMFSVAMDEGRYEDAVRYGERYLSALKQYRNDHSGEIDLSYSSLHRISGEAERAVQVKLADAYFETENYKKARTLLSNIDVTEMEQGEVLQCVATMMNVQSKGKENLRFVLSNVWSQIEKREDAQVCKQAVVNAVRSLFSTKMQKQNSQINYRYACEMFDVLEGKCVLGDAAALLTETKSKRLNAIIARQDNLSALPASALLAALSRGAEFPPQGKPMKMEEMDAFVAHLTEEPDDFLAMACAIKPKKDAQSLCWAKSVTMAGVKICEWNDINCSAKLARSFAEVEREYLSLCYVPNVLTNENCFLLPPMHRFGWYCSRAFEALDAGDAVGCARLLRGGLDSCPEMNKMVEFLLDNIPELQVKPEIPPELEALADQVRMVLARFSPNDPAVALLKQSEAYKKVAYLIDAPNVSTGTTHPIKIFSFWEPESSIPGYLRLCMRSWKRFMPNAEIYILNYENLQKYADVSGIYGSRLFSSGYTLPQISDAIRAIVLEHNGGIWMDIDTIILKPDFEKYLRSSKEVSFFGYPDKKSVHIAWIRAEKHARLMQNWVASNAQRIQNFKETDVDDQFWSWFGNGVVNPYLKEHPEEIEIFDVMKEGSVPELKIIGGDPCQAYIEFYFKKSLHVKDINSSLLLLHNSWTPPEYRDASIDKLLQYNCTMSNILTEFL